MIFFIQQQTNGLGNVQVEKSTWYGALLRSHLHRCKIHVVQRGAAKMGPANKRMAALRSLLSRRSMPGST